MCELSSSASASRDGADVDEVEAEEAASRVVVSMHLGGAE